MEISRTIEGLRTGGLEGSHLLKPNLTAHYPTTIRREGAYLLDSDGQRYFDGSSGAMTANLGHGLRRIGEVMAKQAETVAFAFRNQFSNEPAERLAQKPCELAPGDIRRAFFVNWRTSWARAFSSSRTSQPGCDLDKST
jgi:adenosylmethionine-8-amino-7-oxononanoate aminotransferase